MILQDQLENGVRFYLELIVGCKLMRYFKEFYRFLKHVVESRKLIFMLSHTDFKEKYLGSYLGVFWVIFRPSLFVLIIWFVFSVGFKAKPVDDGAPFILWLLCGFIPWFFFSECLKQSMNAITGNAFFVRKVAFRVSILPLVKVVSALYIHFIFIVILMCILIAYGYKPTIYWLQIPYFIACMIFLLMGLGWIASSLKVFIKDISEIIGVFIQFGFWMTPIFWSLNVVPEQYHAILKLNPMLYIVNGFRGALLQQVWFWDDGYLTIYFLCFSSVTFVGGALLFKRLRPHFGDVL